jgi:hypothetical protein
MSEPKKLGEIIEGCLTGTGCKSCNTRGCPFDRPGNVIAKVPTHTREQLDAAELELFWATSEPGRSRLGKP